MEKKLFDEMTIHMIKMSANDFAETIRTTSLRYDIDDVKGYAADELHKRVEEFERMSDHEFTEYMLKKMLKELFNDGQNN